MPTVPKLERPQIRSQGLPDVRPVQAPTSAFGGGRAGEQLGSAISQTAKIFTEERRKADDVATKDAMWKLINKKNELSTKATEARGKDAFGLPETVTPEFDQYIEELEGEMNESQKQLFSNIKAKYKTEFDHFLQKHIAGERRSFDEQVTKSGLKALRDDAVLNYRDPNKINESINLQKAMIQSHGEDNGYDASVIKEAIETEQSATHRDVISRMLANGEDLLASQYYKNVKDQITGSDATDVEKVLEEGSLRGESQRHADQIMSKFDKATDQYEEARKINDPKLRDAVTKRLRDENRVMRELERQDQEELFNSAILQAEETMQRPDPDVWVQLTHNQRKAIDETIAGRDQTTNWDTYYNLRTQATSDELRQKFLRTNLMEYRPKLADSEFKELVKLQNEMRSGSSKMLDGFRSDNQVVNEALSDAGLQVSRLKPGTDDAKRYNQIRRMVDQRVSVYQERTGKKATNEVVQGIVDQLLVKGDVEGTGIPLFGSFGPRIFTKEKRVFELDPGEALDIDPETIPKSDRNEIARELIRRGQEPTDELIKHWYIQGQSNE